MLNLDKPVQTRVGQKARVICKDRRTETDYKVVVLITPENGIQEEFLTYYTIDGKRQYTSSPEHYTDLINVPEKIAKWMIVVKSNMDSNWSSPYDFASEEAAKRELAGLTAQNVHMRYKIVKIEFIDE